MIENALLSKGCRGAKIRHMAGHTNRGSQLRLPRSVLNNLAPEVGLEPTTPRLTAAPEAVQFDDN